MSTKCFIDDLKITSEISTEITVTERTIVKWPLSRILDVAMKVTDHFWINDFFVYTLINL